MRFNQILILEHVQCLSGLDKWNSFHYFYNAVDIVALLTSSAAFFRTQSRIQFDFKRRSIQRNEIRWLTSGKGSAYSGDKFVVTPAPFMWFNREFSELPNSEFQIEIEFLWLVGGDHQVRRESPNMLTAVTRSSSCISNRFSDRDTGVSSKINISSYIMETSFDLSSKKYAGRQKFACIDDILLLREVNAMKPWKTAHGKMMSAWVNITRVLAENPTFRFSVQSKIFERRWYID